jgi:hypothetical protein
MDSKKPPDKYRTVKCSLQSIIKPTLYMNKLLDACFRTHQIIIHTYQILRLWVLQKYHNKQIIPQITEDTIKMAFKSLIKDSQGPKPKGTNLDLYNELKKLHDDEYTKLNYENKLDGKILSQILSYMATDMLTNIENNIKLHFFKYIKQYVNSSFKKIINQKLETCEKGTKTKLRKQYNKELYEIKEDLINNTLQSDKKYHEWINKNKINIFPKEYKNSYEFDIQNNPQNYIKGMIYMCLEIEKEGTKSFQFFPLRTNNTLKFIPIDSKSIIELFIDEDKNDYLTDIENTKHELWKKYFNIDNPIFRQNKYSFDYRISTDCFSVSIQLIQNDFIQIEKTKKQNLKNKRNEMKELTKNMTQDEKEKYKNQINKNKKDAQEKIKLEKKQQKDKEKEALKKLSKEEKQKLREQKKKDNINIQNNKYIEFPYLEELNEKQYNDLKNNNWLVCDPGRKNLLFLKNKNGLTYRYSNRMHMNKTKRLKYQRLIKNYKDKNGITEIENKLCDHNSKSCNLDIFKKYIQKKNEVNKILLEKYKNSIFRKYKWYSYINSKKAETDLARNIKNIFGKDSIICFGDWSDKLKSSPSRLKYISTPNIRLKRKLNEYFTIYNIDEFRTSYLNYKTETKCENIYLPDKKGIERKIHSVLTYQTENNRMGCINRDQNAVNNMIKLVKTFLINKTRPEKYRRDYKFSEVKDDNPEISASNIIKPAMVQLH